MSEEPDHSLSRDWMTLMCIGCLFVVTVTFGTVLKANRAFEDMRRIVVLQNCDIRSGTEMIELGNAFVSAKVLFEDFRMEWVRLAKKHQAECGREL